MYALGSGVDCFMSALTAFASSDSAVLRSVSLARWLSSCSTDLWYRWYISGSLLKSLFCSGVSALG